MTASTHTAGQPVGAVATERALTLHPAFADRSPWYLATCQQCSPALPMPFESETSANTWTWSHVLGTNHQVLLSCEPRGARG